MKKIYLDVVGAASSAQSQRLAKAHKEMPDMCAVTFLPTLLTALRALAQKIPRMSASSK